MTASLAQEATTSTDARPARQAGSAAAGLAGVLPVQLAPFRDLTLVRTSYPLFLFPAGKGDDPRLSAPLADLLTELVGAFAPGADQATVLKDNLVRFERLVVELMADRNGPTPAAEVFNQGARLLVERLGLAAGPSEQLADQLRKMLAGLPADGRLLPYGRGVTIELFLHVARRRAVVRRAAWRAELHQLRTVLVDLIAVERSNSPEAQGAEALLKAVGESGGAGLDANALANLLGVRRGTETMAPERLTRIETLVARLDEALAANDGPLLQVVYAGDATPCDADPAVELVKSDTPCASALARFDELAARLARVFGAVRAARLEAGDAYDPARHDSLFGNFSWMFFDERELGLVPVVVAVESADTVSAMGMSTLVPMLASGRPVQVVVEVQSARNPGAPVQDPLAGYRIEVGLLGVALRHVFVQQTTPARPEHLLEGAWTVMGSARSGLHVVCDGFHADGSAPPVGPWLSANSAVDSRAHPLFRYDPAAGNAWSDCMRADGNASPEADWVGDEAGNGDGGPGTFTFASHALLDPALARHFRPAREGERLLPVDAWMALSEDAGATSRPAVWADSNGRRFQLVLSAQLAFATRDRRRSWHMLRELAGISNAYAHKAADAARAEARAEAVMEREHLVAAHAQEIERVRAEAAGEAMERLASVLLDADLGSLSTAAPARPAAKAAQAAAPGVEVTQAVAPVQEAEEELVLDDPWVDSALCTTCNDCTNLNPLLFVYNDNKQVIIGDPTKGTFAQLVTAAEKCPSRCIHTGKPKNPSEPGLEDLVKRAAPFR